MVFCPSTVTGDCFKAANYVLAVLFYDANQVIF